MKSEFILGADFWHKFGIRPVVRDNFNEIFEIKRVNAESQVECHHLTNKQQNELESVKKLFSFSIEGKLTSTPLMKHVIDTKDAKPIKQRQYVVSPYIQKEINDEIDRMLKLDIIEPVSSPTWLNPVIAVRKSSGKIRLCLDARQLNEVTVKNTYPPQNANRILGSLKGTDYITAIDLSDAYYQIEIEKESRAKTAFAISSKGTFVYKRMANGLCNAASSLCELVNSVFGSDLEPDAFNYVDDFIIATKTFEQHLERLREVALRLKKAGLTISPEKSRFCMKSVKYLGYVIDKDGIHPDNDKIRPILDYPTPKCVKDVRRLIGCTANGT